MEHRKKIATSQLGTAASLDRSAEPTLGNKIHKAFMAEIGDEMCQAEVAQHANKCPEYFCSRAVRQVHIYKKALGLATGTKKTEECDEEWASSADENQREGSAADVNWDNRRTKRCVTPHSDVDLYEYRTELGFDEGAGLSPHLPTAATPEQQVENVCLYDFFHLVRYHGGKNQSFLGTRKTRSPFCSCTHLSHGPI